MPQMDSMMEAIDVILKGLIATEWPDRDEELMLKEKDKEKETWKKPKE